MKTIEFISLAIMSGTLSMSLTQSAMTVVPHQVYLNGDCVATRAVVNPWSIDPAKTHLDGCVHNGDQAPWIMLRSYVIGSGKPGVHWKWIDGDNTTGCMTDWTLLSCNMTILEEHIANAVGTEGKKRWCPLPVFVPDDKDKKEGLTWQRCGQCDGCWGSKCTHQSCGACVFPSNQDDVTTSNEHN